MQKLFAARDEMEAQMVRDTLADAGIESVVLGQTLAFGRGDLPMTLDTLPAVWVNDEDAQRAVEVVRQFREEAAKPVDAAPWACPKCGEEVEAQFGQCWKCGAEKAAT